MKKIFFAGISAVALTALILTGCAKLPTPEIDAANASISEATSAGAELYAFDNYIKLIDSMDSIMVNVEAQKSKLIKNYGDIKEQLAGITTFAQKVIEETESRKEELKSEIQSTISEVKTLIETNRQLILEAPRGKEGTTALMAIRDELNAIETTIQDAGNMLVEGEYMATLEKARSAREKAASINTELTSVIAKYKMNVRNRS